MELRGTIPLEQRQRYMWLDVTAPSGGDCARCQMLGGTILVAGWSM